MRQASATRYYENKGQPTRIERTPDFISVTFDEGADPAEIEAATLTAPKVPALRADTVRRGFSANGPIIRPMASP